MAVFCFFFTDMLKMLHIMYNINIMSLKHFFVFYLRLPHSGLSTECRSGPHFERRAPADKQNDSSRGSQHVSTQH